MTQQIVTREWLEQHKQAQHEVSDEIELRLTDGEHLNIDKLIHEYYPELHPLEANTMVRGRVATARHRLAKKGVAICLVGQKTFGVPKTKVQYTYGQMWYARQVQGLVKQAFQLYKFGQQQNLIPAGLKKERLMLPVIYDK